MVIAGPTKGGKKKLVKKLIDKHPELFEVAVSHTTRKIREGEVEGKQYHYISKDQFMDLIAKNTILEYFEKDEQYFGITKGNVDKIRAKNKIPVIISIKM